MPSWQARCLNAAVRSFVRRRRWGDDELAVARSARRVFGSPKIYQWIRARGLVVSPVRDGDVRGEWIMPKDHGEGVILYIHGGGFVSCSAATHRQIAASLARLTGQRVFSIDYRLAPEHRFPAALDDAVAAYRWLVEQKIPPRSISLAGDSAGGGLVLSLLLRIRDEGSPAPACAVCFSAWTDLAGTGDSVRANDGRCAMFHPENIPEYAAVYLGEHSPLDPYASPVHADLSGLPPVLLQVGSTELLLDDSRRVHSKIQDAGGISELRIFDDLAHCWQMLDGLVPEAREALKDAAAFIRHHSAEQPEGQHR